MRRLIIPCQAEYVALVAMPFKLDTTFVKLYMIFITDRIYGENSVQWINFRLNAMIMYFIEELHILGNKCKCW